MEAIMAPDTTATIIQLVPWGFGRFGGFGGFVGLVETGWKFIGGFFRGFCGKVLRGGLRGFEGF